MENTKLVTTRTGDDQNAQLLFHRLPIHFKCSFTDKTKKKVAFIYKIEPTISMLYSFHLLKLARGRSSGWESLSVYTSVDACLKYLLQELFAESLTHEVDHGYSTIDPYSIINKINRGDRLVSIFDKSHNDAFCIEYDVSVEDIIKPV